MTEKEAFEKLADLVRNARQHFEMARAFADEYGLPFELILTTESDQDTKIRDAINAAEWARNWDHSGCSGN